MTQLVNNWTAALELQRFKSMYVDTLVKKYEAHRDSLELIRKKGGNCAHEKRMVDRLEGQMINFSRLHSSMLNLISQHEELVDKLFELHHKWKEDISVNGTQPKEIMGLQAKMLEVIFKEIYDMIKPALN